MMHSRERGTGVDADVGSAVKLGVDLHDFGREHALTRPIKDTHLERHERMVMVDARHTRGHQLMPIEILHVDARHPGAAPLAETSYAYAERPDGTVATQSIQQIARTERGLETQSMMRTFSKAGEALHEQLSVNRAVVRERMYVSSGSADGEMVYDNVFDDRGRVVGRQMYARRSGEREWQVTATRYTYDDKGDHQEDTDHRLARLGNPPAFEGVSLLEHVAAPSLPYEEPAPTISFENSDR